MFRIRDLKNGLYQVHKKNGPAFEGELKQIAKKGKYMGINIDHMLMAIEKLCLNDHDYADFNDKGLLIYTQLDYKKKAS